MKKHNIIFTTLFLTLTTMPSVVSALTVSGTVVDEAGEPLIGATIRDTNNNKKAVITDTDGKFTLNVEANHNLEVSYIGYKTQTIDNPTENLNIALEEDNKVLNEVVVKPCNNEDKQKINAKTASNRQIEIAGKTISVCLADTCIGELGEYEKQETYLNDDNACTEKDKFNKNGTERVLCRSICVKVKCTNSEKQALNATEGKIENGKCVPNECIQDYELKNNTCVHKVCTNQEKKDLNATEAEYKGGKCIPTECKNKYHLENGNCVENKCPTKELEKLRASAGYMQDDKCIPTACIDKYKLENNTCVNSDILAEKQKAYDDAKAKEQSTENKLLGGLSTAATGIGGMQLMQGLAEQSSDKDAAADMAAYIETMRCTYGDGKQVKAGPDEIELPGANDSELMKLRSEYLALAADLKERKEALGMKPGIESEVIVDRTQTGLYDDENIAISGGNYGSLYRAQMLNSESDQAKIADEKSISSNRVKGGAIAAGAGVVGGILGNELINGKLGEKLKEKNQGKSLRAAVKIEKDALEDMKKCLKDASVKDSDSLEFQNFYISVLSIKNINCRTEITKISNTKPSDIAAKTLFADSNDTNVIYNKLIESFGPTIAGKMIGVTLSQQPTDVQKQNAINTLKSGIDKVTKRFQDAAKEDEKRLSSSGLKDFDIDFSSILSSFNGDGASSSIMDMVNNGFK